MTIRPPRQSGDYVERDLDCQEAMETALLGILDAAKQAGWREAESYQAVMTLIVSFQLVSDDDEAISEEG